MYAVHFVGIIEKCLNIFVSMCHVRLKFQARTWETVQQNVKLLVEQNVALQPQSRVPLAVRQPERLVKKVVGR
jgi:hypothetical protein